MTPPVDWWTPADGAELDALLWELVSGYFEHRQLCPTCLEGRIPCRAVQAAIAEVCDWRQARILLSRAQALRAEQEYAT